ncbi:MULTISPECIES: flagellar motor switch protein FliG [Larsenimonas]|uniref:Flagellar motor switch protein FliG n=1 Tax=Larsenimonas suaedae TaxID=1851019 RepID=A0ABU1GU92_9GAMM|nr:MULTISPECIES: flagellar motor switch protein FliG [Larsenimonas]MCM2971605.1 flagellar motor switch protein FliG [Larsenimonas suaedae]MCM5703710.1 flagellar motor switch protein FliG [Larsenimonas salina]MDR5895157.1 flagellar motor switch protein FliG [Larsenimonas suaedae]
MANNSPFNEEGLERSAILMMTLDEDTAADVFKYMSPKEIQQLGLAMAGLRQVPKERIAEVLRQFDSELDQLSAVDINSGDHIRTVLIKALGEDRAASILEDIFEANHGSGIDALNLMEPTVVAEMIRDEHPQIIATVIVHLERHQAADILALFDDALRNDIVLRIATFSGVQPAALQELTEVLGGLLDGQNLKRSKMGGVRTAAEILNLMNSTQEESVIDTVRNYSDSLAQQIIDEMFVFENIADLDDRTIQRILQDVDTNSLVVALKGSPEELINRVLSNMSNRAAEMLREDMQMRGPLRVSVVETEQKNILQLIRKLADSGEIQISGGDEAYV